MSDQDTAAPASEPVNQSSGGWDDEPAESSGGWDDDEPDTKEASQSDKAQAPKPKAKSEDDDDESEATDDSADKADAKPKTKKKYVRVGDELMEEGELLKLREKAKGADKLFREAAEMRKNSQAQIQKFFQSFLQDPQSILSHPKLNIPVEKRKEIGEQLLRQALEYEMSDPRDRELAKYKQREQLEQQERQRREAEEQTNEMKQKTEARKREISDQLAKAMELTPLSKDPITAASTLREMALYLRAARQNGESPTPEDIANHVADKRHREYYALANTLSGEELVSFLGDEVVKKISKYQIDKLRQRRGAGQQQSANQSSASWGSPKPKNKQRTRIDPMGARERARQRLGLE